MKIKDFVNFIKLMKELGFTTLEELSNYMNECRLACEHSCDNTSIERDKMSVKDEFIHQWFDYEQLYDYNFSID